MTITGRLDGKTAIITGATRGIGEGIARRLAAEGAALIVSGVDVDDGERVAGEIGGLARFVVADVTRAADCGRLVQAALDLGGRLDVLVNNAGIFPSLPLEAMTADEWDAVFAVNVRGAFLCCQAAIPLMQQAGGGAIINIGSKLAHEATVERLAYAASKAALLNMTKTLARSYLQDRIRVNWVTVGWVASPGEVALRASLHGNGAAFLNQQAANAPFGRLETADDIAAGVAFLASDEAGHITGCELNISGGLYI